MSPSLTPEPALSSTSPSSKVAELRRAETVLRRIFVAAAAVMIASVVGMAAAGVVFGPLAAIAVVASIFCLGGASIAMLTIILGRAVVARIAELESQTNH